MADLEALANNLTLARKHVDQNDNVTASLYYETTLSMINKRMQHVDRDTATQYSTLIRTLQLELAKCKELARLQQEEPEWPAPISSPSAASAAARQRQQGNFNEAVMSDDGFRPSVQSHASADDEDPEVWKPPPRQLGRQSSTADYKPPVGKSRLPQWALDGMRGGNQPGALAKGSAGPAAAPGPANKRKPAVPTRQVPSKVDSWQQPRGGPAAAAAPASGRPSAAASGAAAGGVPKQAPAGKAGEYSGPDGDLWAALARDVLEASLNVKFDDIAGLSEAKRVLQEAILLPMLMPEMFTGICKPVKGVMLFGPPGTGKTLLARAVASECDCTFFNISSSTLASKYRGESEKMVRLLFEMARAHAPSVIFIDEIDSLATQRGAQGEHEASRRVKAELLTQLDGIHSSSDGEERRHVLVLSATNFPWDIDEALRRRLEKRIYIPLPEQEQRLELLRINLKGRTMAPDVDLKEVARQTAGYSGDDITNICRDAAMEPVRRKISNLGIERIKEMAAARGGGQPAAPEPDVLLTMADFVSAISKINPSVSPDDIKRHEQYNQQYGAS